MRKKLCIVIMIIAIITLFFGIGELVGVFPWQYLEKDNVESFIEDSHYAFIYELPAEEDKIEWESVLTNDLANEITAVTYAARTKFSLDKQGDAYIISNNELAGEKERLFENLEDVTDADSQLLTSTNDGYLLHLDVAQNQNLSYEIIDSNYGLIGSEATRITVLYKLNGEECELEYVLASDKDSPYKFKVVDISLSE